MRNIQLIIFFFIVMISTFPLTKWIPYSEQLAIILMITWLIIHIVFYGLLKKYQLYYGILLSYLLYIFVVSIFSGNTILFNRYMNLFILYYFFIVFLESRGNKLYKLKDIINLSYVTILCTLIITIYHVYNNPFIIRSIKSSGEYSLEIQKLGVGGYSFVYLIVFFNLIIMYFIFNKDKNKIHNKYKKIGLVLYVCLNIILIMFANYLTALFITFVGLMILLPKFLIKMKYSSWLKIASVIILFSIIFWKLFIIKTLNFLYITINNLNTKQRILELIISLEKSTISSNSGGASERIYTWSESINSFLSSPFFGISIRKIEFNNGGFLDGFGQHSFILDTFSLFGVFIGLINIYLILYPFNILYKNSVDELKPIILVICTSAIYFFLVNNATPSIGYVLYYLFPWLCYSYQEQLTAKKVEVNNVKKY